MSLHDLIPDVPKRGPERAMTNRVWRGEVAVSGDELFVRLPGADNGAHLFGPSRLTGGRTPRPGEACLVQFDDENEPWVSVRGSDLVLNVKDVVGNGVTNDAPAVTELLAQGASENRPVLLPRDVTVRADSSINLPSSVEFIVDGAIDGSNAPEFTNILRLNGEIVSSALLASTANRGDTEVTVVAGGGASFQVGDWVKVVSDAATSTVVTSATEGEFVEVESVMGDVLSLHTALRGGPYATGDSAAVERHDLARDVILRGHGLVRGGGAESTHRGFRARKTLNLLVGGSLRFESCEASSMILVDCVDAEVWAPRYLDSDHTSSGYGINMVDATQDCKVFGGYAHRCRHATSVASSAGGIPRNNWVFGMVARETIPTGDCFDSHGLGEIHYRDCVSIDSGNNGFNVEAPVSSLAGCRVYNAANHGYRFENKSSAYPARVSIDDCEADDSGNMGFRFDVLTDAPPPELLRINGLSLVRSAARSMHIVGDTERIKTLVMSGIVIDSPLDTTVVTHLSGIDNLSAADVVARDVPASAHVCRAVDVKDAGFLNWRGRHASTGTGRMFSVQGGKNVQFDGCRSPNAAVGIWADADSENLVIGGSNDFSGCTTRYSLAGTGHRVTMPERVQVISTDAGANLVAFTDGPTILHTGTLTATRSLNLGAANAFAGARMRFTRTGGGASNLNVRDNTGGSPVLLKALATDEWCEVVYDGSAWKLAAFGGL